MQDIQGRIAGLERPKLLVQAARCGLQEYRREPALDRLLGAGRPRRCGETALCLLEIEADLDGQRRADQAGYSIARHVDVLIALMGEARLLRDSARAVARVR